TDTLVILLLIELLKEHLETDEMPSHMLLLAQGGYGRRELHPKSDIDLIFLHQHPLSEPEKELVKSIFRTLFDVGFHVGHCCRSYKEALETATKDDTSRTAMSESRFLAGDWRLFEKFKHDFWHTVAKNRKEYIRYKIIERNDRNARQGTTINISEPNVKESPGGLRDYQFGLWVGSLVKNRTMNLLHLKRAHFIDDRAMDRVEDAVTFLWRLRTDLHFLTGKEQDVLIMPIQKEVSQRLGYSDQRGRLSEEQMMRDYYKHASVLLDFAERMAQKCSPRPVWEFFKYKGKKSLTDGFFLFDKKIHMPPNFYFFEHHPPRLIQAFILSAQYQVPLAEETMVAIRDNLELIDKAFLHHKDTAKLLRQFFSLSHPIEPALQCMRKIGMLECLFPEWRDIANLVRYDLVHRFTVDEHSILCLYHLDHLAEDGMKHANDRRAIWDQLEQKDILRLAVLFHDIGKGRNGDHSILGAEIVEQIARRMRYQKEDRNKIQFLISKHLLMSHTAQHRDLADPEVTADFVDDFDSPELINMMYLLTYVDMKSVSPEAMTEWKNNLLWRLYMASRELLVGDSVSEEEHSRALSEKEMIIKELENDFDRELIENHLDNLPHNYLLYQTINHIRQHLEMIRIFDGKEPVVRFYPHIDPACREMALVHNDRVGLINRISSAVRLENFDIEEARLNTRADKIVANNIVIRDALQNTDISESRQILLKDRITRILTAAEPPPTVPPSLGRTPIGRTSFENHAKIFNDSSSRFTVIVIRCVDRPGLLQDLTSVFTEMNMNIHFARIITEGNRVTDVFYMTDETGNKIMHREALQSIQQRMMDILSTEQ
ncbi:[protein-PII] uridylyltransferase, partial [bacterium]|nr:[protein-PII] uridylyltransferase [bacterium]